MTTLVSACLLGVPCRYDGAGAEVPGLGDLMRRHTLIPVCPEQLGGLPVPRPPIELQGGKALTKSGEDVTSACERGAGETLRLARLYGATHAILKQRSPTCGSRIIYDGSFTGKRIPGMGLTARLLAENGITVLDETELDSLL